MPARLKSDSRRAKWGRRLLFSFSAAGLALGFPTVLGALVPRMPWVGPLGAILESFLTLHVFLLSLLALAMAVIASKMSGGRPPKVLAVIAGVTVLGSVLPLIAFVRTANQYHAPISWLEHLHVSAMGPRAVPEHSLVYATVEGRELSLDVYLPSRNRRQLSSAIIMIHGGGFSSGKRSDGRNWDRWLANQGHTVFDVEYRLTPPPTWNRAAQDVACALSWVRRHASDYHVASDHIVLAGQSGGANLALQVAYGLGDGTVSSSCDSSVPQPSAVVALYPPEDLLLGWNLDSGIGPAKMRRIARDYIGGSPEEFPDRYHATSPTFHVRPNVPPTLIAFGHNDHLVPVEGHFQMEAKLAQAGVPHMLIDVPYSDHAYDAAWGSLGAQITRSAVEQFLMQNLSTK